MNKDLKIIKKKYGEDMMHFCRRFFPSILEEPGLLPKLLLASFNPSHDLYADLLSANLETEFVNFIYGLIENKNKEPEKTIATPKELLSYAGYDFYECHTEEDIQKFKKYYDKDERICTFNGGRLNTCHVFFAVKKNVAEINREDFYYPKREDEYGTSVISIQFKKDKTNLLSIKNRYNDAVANPDMTFSNNLDNIIPGLTNSFATHYGLKQQFAASNLEIPGYVRASDGKYYKYNYLIEEVYYCPNNIIIDSSKVQKYDKEKYIVLDYFLLDLQNKKITLYDNVISDSFPSTIKDIAKITVINNNTTKDIFIITKTGKVKITVNKDNQILRISNDYTKEVADNFLAYNTTLTSLDMPNLKRILNNFLCYNRTLKEINIPNVEKIGNKFLYSNEYLEKISLPQLFFIGDCFLYLNHHLKEIDLAQVKEIGNYFLYSNQELKHISMPELTLVGDSFLSENANIYFVFFPKLKLIGNKFLEFNNNLSHVYLPNVIQVGDDFMTYNTSINFVYAPCLAQIGHKFLASNSALKSINFPSAQVIGDFFLDANKILENINLPNVTEIGNYFLASNLELSAIDFAELLKVGVSFIPKNKQLVVVNIPNLKEFGRCFLNSMPQVSQRIKNYLEQNRNSKLILAK